MAFSTARIRARSRGQAILLVTLSIPVMLGLLGLVVDVGWMYWRKEACLTAAQAGAFAAAMTASKSTTSYPATCNTSSALWCSATPVSCDASPTNPPVNNFQTACLYAKANGFSPGNSGQVVKVAANNGSTTDAPNVSPSYYITVTVAEKIPLTFLATLGRGYFGVASASATAGVVSTVAGGCVYVLDPSAKDALNASNNAQIQPNCGVYVNSTNSEAALAVGSASVTTSGTPQPPIQVVGGYAYNNNGSFHPTPVSGSTAVSDPLGSLDIPWTNCTGSGCATTNCQYTGCSGSATHCDHTSFGVTSGSWSAPYTHISPGIYCGGISISNGNSAIFDSGMYVINGGSVSIMSGSGNTGSNVVFYFTGTNATMGGLSIANGAMATFTAPTTGDLADVLVYGDRSLTSPTTQVGINIQGGTTANLTGILYMPNSEVDFGNGTSIKTGSSVVVKRAVFNGGTYVFTPDPAGTLTGSGSAIPYLIASH